LQDGDRVALTAEAPLRFGEAELRARHVRGVVFQANALFEGLGSLEPPPGAAVIEPLVVRLNAQLPAGPLGCIGEEGRFGFGQRLLLERFELLNNFGAFVLANQLVERGTPLFGASALVVALLRFLELLADAIGGRARGLGLGADGIDARIPGELQGDEHDDDEDHVGRGARPDQAALRRLLTARDALQVG
jgi:hypothetical protein